MAMLVVNPSGLPTQSCKPPPSMVMKKLRAPPSDASKSADYLKNKAEAKAEARKLYDFFEPGKLAPRQGAQQLVWLVEHTINNLLYRGKQLPSSVICKIYNTCR